VLNWFGAFLPKEDRFFDLFEPHARLVLAGTEGLRSALNGGPFRRDIWEASSPFDRAAGREAPARSAKKRRAPVTFSSASG